jgi:hypothetical protein
LYDYPKDSEKKLLRPVTVRTNYKEIPVTHIHTNLIAVGKSKEDFEQWLKSYKGKK